MSTPVRKLAPASQRGAELLVKSLEVQGIEYIFGIPGAKNRRRFRQALGFASQDCRLPARTKRGVCCGRHWPHDGKAGVALVTSGPGCSNLVTGLATANSEGDPVVAIGGAVPLADRLKQIHQSRDTVNLFRPITKFSVEIDSPNSVSEVIANAFRAAESGRPGAAFVSMPKDIMAGPADGDILTPATAETLGVADSEAIASAARLISCAERPVLLLGLLASEASTAEAIRELLMKTSIPVVCTYQGAGVVPRERFDHFGGRVGLFHTQPADKLLDAADVVIAVGYNPIEYEPRLWNQGRKREIVHIDITRADIDRDYRPQFELTGNIAGTIRLLTRLLDNKTFPADGAVLAEIARDRMLFNERAAASNGVPIHPMRLVKELQELLSDDMTLCLDMGSFHIWLARYLYSFRARQILMTNGQQTLGVGLPWAIAACLVRTIPSVVIN
jgi:acetolactate synthase I/II/III large subunit